MGWLLREQPASLPLFCINLLFYGFVLIPPPTPCLGAAAGRAARRGRDVAGAAGAARPRVSAGSLCPPSPSAPLPRGGDAHTKPRPQTPVPAAFPRVAARVGARGVPLRYLCSLLLPQHPLISCRAPSYPAIILSPLLCTFFFFLFRPSFWGLGGKIAEMGNLMLELPKVQLPAGLCQVRVCPAPWTLPGEQTTSTRGFLCV